MTAKTEVTKATIPSRVAQSRAMLTATYSLSLAAKRILLMFLAELNRREDWRDIPDGPDTYFVVTPAMYQEAFGCDPAKASRDVNSAVIELYNAEIKFTSEDGLTIHKYRWMPSLLTNVKRGVFKMKFNEELEPYLLDLSKGFTAYGIPEVSKLTAVNQIRLYEELIDTSNRGGGRGWRVLPLDFFAKHYDFGASVTAKPAQFKRHFLNAAIKKINTVTPLRVALDEEKTKNGMFHFMVIDTREVEKANTDGKSIKPAEYEAIK